MLLLRPERFNVTVPGDAPDGDVSVKAQIGGVSSTAGARCCL